MPTLPRGKTAGDVESGQVTPEEAGRIRASVTAKEQGPTSRQQTELFGDWRQARDQLGSPFEVERIPLSKLFAMRRDPMLAFGLSFIKTPHMRAKWFINAKDREGPNAQIAAHLDHDLRQIYPSFVQAFCNSLDFGFQAIVKRFQIRTPATTYIERSEAGEETELPVWDEGNVDPIAWKPFVALPPGYVNPVWGGQGQFEGIEFSAENAVAPAGITALNTDKGFKIDLYHALWVTNEREQNFGNVFGFPRLGYAYRYWWSYWFRWAIADRAFERKADPSVKVLHPEGNSWMRTLVRLPPTVSTPC